MSYEPRRTTDPVEPAERSSWTSYAAVKYGFIFLIVVAILWFVANYLLPAIS